MEFYKSGIERMIQAARARRISCGARCVPNIANPSGGGQGTGALYTAWLNQGGGNGAATSTGGNTPTGTDKSGNGSGQGKTGVNSFACVANVGGSGTSCQRHPSGRYTTLAECISATDCSE